MQPRREIIESQPEFYLLREIPRVPTQVWFLGNLAALMRPTIAIVGSRRPSRYAVYASFNFARELARRGWTIASGLALGVDTAAHLGALSVQGSTVAVLGHGLDRIYPRTNVSLAHRIIEAAGSLISEYDPGVPPLPHHFPERNRLISGLSWGTLVVEARSESGSLITARCALEQGREVFVLPGPFYSKSFCGSHDLIQQGAKLVFHVEDILEEFGIPFETTQNAPETPQDARLHELFMKNDGIATLDEICSVGRLSRLDAVEEMERAVARSRCVEIAPRVFLWCENS